MSKNIWLNTTVDRSRLVAPNHGRGMGEVCPNAAVNAAYRSAGSVKRHMTDAFQATTPGSRMPWRPPVT